MAVASPATSSTSSSAAARSKRQRVASRSEATQRAQRQMASLPTMAPTARKFERVVLPPKGRDEMYSAADLYVAMQGGDMAAQAAKSELERKQAAAQRARARKKKTASQLATVMHMEALEASGQAPPVPALAPTQAVYRTRRLNALDSPALMRSLRSSLVLNLFQDGFAVNSEQCPYIPYERSNEPFLRALDRGEVPEFSGNILRELRCHFYEGAFVVEVLDFRHSTSEYKAPMRSRFLVEPGTGSVAEDLAQLVSEKRLPIDASSRPVQLAFEERVLRAVHPKLRLTPSPSITQLANLLEYNKRAAFARPLPKREVLARLQPHTSAKVRHEYEHDKARRRGMVNDTVERIKAQVEQSKTALAATAAALAAANGAKSSRSRKRKQAGGASTLSSRSPKKPCIEAVENLARSHRSLIGTIPDHQHPAQCLADFTFSRRSLDGHAPAHAAAATTTQSKGLPSLLDPLDPGRTCPISFSSLTSPPLPVRSVIPKTSSSAASASAAASSSAASAGSDDVADLETRREFYEARRSLVLMQQANFMHSSRFGRSHDAHNKLILDPLLCRTIFNPAPSQNFNSTDAARRVTIDTQFNFKPPSQRPLPQTAPPQGKDRKSYLFVKRSNSNVASQVHELVTTASACDSTKQVHDGTFEGGLRIRSPLDRTPSLMRFRLGSARSSSRFITEYKRLSQLEGRQLLSAKDYAPGAGTPAAAAAAVAAAAAAAARKSSSSSQQQYAPARGASYGRPPTHTAPAAASNRSRQSHYYANRSKGAPVPSQPAPASASSPQYRGGYVARRASPVQYSSQRPGQAPPVKRSSSHGARANQRRQSSLSSAEPSAQALQTPLVNRLPSSANRRG